MQRPQRLTAIGGALAIMGLLHGAGTGHAAGRSVAISARCWQAGDNGECQISGSGFPAHGYMYVDYDVKIYGSDGNSQETTYHRQFKADAAGRFRRPILVFTHDPRDGCEVDMTFGTVMATPPDSVGGSLNLTLN